MNVNIFLRTVARPMLLAAGISILTVPALAAAVSRSAPLATGVATNAAPGTMQAISSALRPVVYQSLANNMGAAYHIKRNGCATLPRQSFKACFNRRGARFTGAGMPLLLNLTAYGRGNGLTPVKDVRPAIKSDRVSYRHGNLTEWWRVLPIGFEQGFTLARRPAGHGKLTLALAVSRQDAGAPESGVLSWGKLHYGDLVVTDAQGKVVPATLKTQGNRILIAVNDADAVYPLTVDPLIWLEQEVSSSDGAAGDSFGWSVAVSGATALIGTPFATVDDNAYQGAAYIFTKSDGRWAQTAKLIAGDGASGDQFGMWVALAGTTALVGAPFGNEAAGAAYVFGESDGAWTQTAMLSASDGASGDDFGWSVALDGATALVGAPFATVEDHGDQGAAYVFDESNGAWAQTTKLTAADGTANDEFGWSVGLDDATALVSAYGADDYTGAAYVFGKSAGTWAQTQKLTASDGATNDNFGWRVALDGMTALIGADGASDYSGAVYVFGQSAGVWTQAQKLTANGGASGDDFGWSVALAGPTAIVGAAYGNEGTGAAYAFGESNGTWMQTQELTASNGEAFDGFGWSAALNGTTALVGADGAIINGNSFQGAGYFEGQSDLGLAESAPQSVAKGQQYVGQTIVTNNASAASPAVSATVTVPAAASFVSATATQGSCSEASGVVTCAFGAIDGNAGTATANVTLKATGNVGDTIDNTASIAKATPPLSASTPTAIITGGACPDGYTEYDGSLNPGEVVRSPVYQAPGGSENAILTAPARFELYAVYQSGRFGQHVYLVPGNEVHRWGPKGLYMWLVRARDGAGAYTLCLMHP